MSRFSFLPHIWLFQGDETGIDCGGSCLPDTPCACFQGAIEIPCSCLNTVWDGPYLKDARCSDASYGSQTACANAGKSWIPAMYIQGEAGIDCGGPCMKCTCFDGYRNGDEATDSCGTDTPCVDCGGADSADGLACLPCHCYNGVKDAGSDETGKDCGGPCGYNRAGSPQAKLPFRENMYSVAPTRGTCSASTSKHCLHDGHCPGHETCDIATRCDDECWNGDETAVDCGGTCDACDPSCHDGISNGDETGIDCGGSCGLNNPNADQVSSKCTDLCQNARRRLRCVHYRRRCPDSHFRFPTHLASRETRTALTAAGRVGTRAITAPYARITRTARIATTAYGTAGKRAWTAAGSAGRVPATARALRRRRGSASPPE